MAGVKVEARRAQVSTLVMAGATQREIAERLGVSPATINSDIKALQEDWAKKREDISFQFDLDLARLDSLLMSVWAAASRGNVPAVTAALNVLDRRGRMLGYDALDEEVKKQLQRRAAIAQGGTGEMSDEALLQIAAGLNR